MINVAYALTRNVYSWLLPSVRSLVWHNPDAKIFILAEDDALPVDLAGDITVVNISNQKYFPEIAQHRTEAFGGYINHLKVRYADILPVDKVVHIDIDTIVCDKLDGLWNADVSGDWFAAVPEYAQSWYRPYGDKYYNMGVALLNLEQMRKDNAGDLMADFLKTTDQPFADQNAWNKFGYELCKASELLLRYNESRVTGMTDNPAIIHYCSIPDWWTNTDMVRREYLDRWKA